MILHWRIRLDRTDDFQKFCGSGLDWIQFLRIRIGLGLKSLSVRSSLNSTGSGNGSVAVGPWFGFS